MAPTSRLCVLLRPTSTTTPSALSSLTCRAHARAIHRPSAQPAKVVPVYGTGPPPEPPTPALEYSDAAARIARRRRQMEMLKQAKDVRAAASARNKAGHGGDGKEKTGLRKRFWKEVRVVEVDGAFEAHLDTRPLRHPTTKKTVRLPLNKPALATALAIEWDQLVSAQDATRQHLIPLTSLVCRALDIADDDAAHAASSGDGSVNGSKTPAPVRSAIATVLLRYLDTDSLLCWAPQADRNDPTSPSNMINDAGKSLHDLQEEAALPIVSFLTSRVWPGVTIAPVLEEGSIMPRQQAPGTREVIQGWILGLSPWELAALERGTLAGKSLLAAARLLVEWSEGGAGLVAAGADETTATPIFGAEEAARAVSVEVDWQTGRWGEVEDTHDVEKEDLRRQLGSVVLLVLGAGSPKPKL